MNKPELFFILVCSLVLLGPKCHKEQPYEQSTRQIIRPSNPTLPSQISLKDSEFKQAFARFEVDAEFARFLSPDERDEIIQFTAYFRNDLTFSKKAAALALLLQKFTNAVNDNSQSAAFLIFLTSGTGIEEFIFTNELLKRTSIKLLIDFINPACSLNEHNALMATKMIRITNLFFEFLAHKYPDRIIAFHIRSNDCALSIKQLLRSDSSLTSDAFAEHLQKNPQSPVRTIALAGFSSKSSYQRVRTLIKDYCPKQIRFISIFAEHKKI